MCRAAQEADRLAFPRPGQIPSPVATGTETAPLAGRPGRLGICGSLYGAPWPCDLGSLRGPQEKGSAPLHTRNSPYILDYAPAAALSAVEQFVKARDRDRQGRPPKGRCGRSGACLMGCAYRDGQPLPITRSLSEYVLAPQIFPKTSPPSATMPGPACGDPRLKPLADSVHLRPLGSFPALWRSAAVRWGVTIVGTQRPEKKTEWKKKLLKECRSHWP